MKQEPNKCYKPDHQMSSSTFATKNAVTILKTIAKLLQVDTISMLQVNQKYKLVVHGILYVASARPS